VRPNPPPVRVLGIDETRGEPSWQRCKATGRWVHQDPWDTGFIDLFGGSRPIRAGRGGARMHKAPSVPWSLARLRLVLSFQAALSGSSGIVDAFCDV
jgi:hypothetical protein